MKTLAGIAGLSFALSCQAGAPAPAAADLRFMSGYTKEYPGCVVSWSDRTESFLKAGDRCDELSLHRLADDAVAEFHDKGVTTGASSFADIQREAHPGGAYTSEQASVDAQGIWRSGCSDFKSGMNAGDFQGWMRLGSSEKSHPSIKKTAVIRLYMDGWDTARKLGGVINCGDVASSRASDFISGIDIRS